MNATAAPSGRLWKWLAGLAAFVVVAAAGVVVWGAASGGVSAGPRGDASPTPGEAAQTGPTPASTDGPRGPSGELGWDDIERLGLGAPGDGGFALSGPNVFASGEPDQTFYILVGNAAKPKSTYTVVAVIDGDQEVTVEVTL
ncbi:MAG: hypothetical protein LBK95_03150, partial [Bifidobacteriaceae bacterium]|nr:hypothetical protein [Bifidobacteriaceae bacterium]